MGKVQGERGEGKALPVVAISPDGTSSDRILASL